MARQDLLGLSVSHRRGPAPRLLHRGSDALVLTLIVVLGFGVWIGVPLGWLWLGSQIQGATQSLGAAVGAMLLGSVITVAVLFSALVWLADRHRAIQMAQGREDPGRFVLEGVLVTCAMVALAGFAVWFFFFAGASPVPFLGRNG